MSKGYEPGSFGCHEALHMASYFIDAIDNELVDHPAIKANEEWSKLASAAMDALFQLYQSIGQKHL